MHIVFFQENPAGHTSNVATWSAQALQAACSARITPSYRGKELANRLQEGHQRQEAFQEALATHLSS